MNYNRNKYYLVHSDALTEAGKVRFAEALLELERRGVIEYRDGLWGLAPGVEVEETSDSPVARFPKKRRTASPARSSKSSTASSGEPSETRVPPLEQAARPSSQGPGSPDLTPQDADWEER